MKKKTTKATYRIRNWKKYNQALIHRGSLTVWIEQDVLSGWNNTERTGKRGAPRQYSDQAILCILTLMEVYHLPLRPAGMDRVIDAVDGVGYTHSKLLNVSSAEGVGRLLASSVSGTRPSCGG